MGEFKILKIILEFLLGLQSSEAAHFKHFSIHYWVVASVDTSRPPECPLSTLQSILLAL
jgi:hypothetical protein